MAAVEDLGKQRASGVLEISGSPSGAVYLDGGHITFARASWVPGLAARMRSVSPSPDALAELAVARGYLTGARLHELIKSIVLDSLLVLAIPLAMDSPVAAIRFVSTRTYWTDMFPRLDIPSVRGEAIRRAKGLADYGLSPTTSVALCDLRRPSAVLTRDQWAVASKIIVRASARDIALRDGTALIDTADCLGALIRAGVCGPVRVGKSRQLTAGPADAVPDGLPSRRTGPGRPWLGAPGLGGTVSGQPGPDYSGRGETRMEQPPSADVLRQVLSGLRKLS
jgi:hypothetical protein